MAVGATLYWGDGDELGHGDDLLGDSNNLLDNDNLDNLSWANSLEGGGGKLLVELKWDWLWGLGDSWWWSWGLDGWLNWGGLLWCWCWLLLGEDTWRNLWRRSSLGWSWWWGSSSLWHGHGGGIPWAVGDWRVTWHLLEWTHEVLALDLVWHVEEALLRVLTFLDVEDWAVLDSSGDVGASVNSLLENTILPAHDEVTMVTVTSWVTVGEDELSVNAVESVGVPDDLKHETWKTSLEALWAGAGHDGVWVLDVGLVAGTTGEALAVPAGWEHELNADTVLASGIQEGLGWHLVAEERWLCVNSVVEAVEAHGASLWVGGIERALGSVASNHGEAWWVGSDLLLSWRVVEEVVSGRC